MLFSLTFTDNVSFFLYYGNLHIMLIFMRDLSIGTLWDIGYVYIYTYTYRIHTHTHIYSNPEII